MPDILIIDDNQNFQAGLAANLRKAGFAVETASNGIQGQKLAREGHPELILCDIKMPGLDGLAVKKALNLEEATAGIPFIFISAISTPIFINTGLRSGADDYITKPFEIDELLARIQSVLAHKQLDHPKEIRLAADTRTRLINIIQKNLTRKIRKPLTVLLSTLELAALDKFAQSIDDLPNRPGKSAERINFLIKDLEILDAIDQNNLIASRENIDIDAHLLAPIQQTLKSWEEIKQLDCQIDIDPNVVIYAPSDEFHHVVTHLVDNACKFSPEKGKIAISVKQFGLGGCVLEVADNGCGIPISLRAKVFERYYQANLVADLDPYDTRKYAGLGVGLTIARAFAQSILGDVQILDSVAGCMLRMVLLPIDFE